MAELVQGEIEAMKGVVVPYIIAIMLGIIVLALLGYWFFFAGGRLSGEIQPGCERLKERYCQEWKASEYSVEPIINKWKPELCPIEQKPTTKEQCEPVLKQTTLETTTTNRRGVVIE